MVSLSMIAVFLVKSFHHHEIRTADRATHSSSEKHRLHEDCQICQFTFSSFTEAETAVAHLFDISKSIDLPIEESQNLFATAIYTFLLRAPPTR